MDLNDWWVAALILFVLFSISGGSAHVDDTQSTNHEVDDDDDPCVFRSLLDTQFGFSWTAGTERTGPLGRPSWTRVNCWR